MRSKTAAKTSATLQGLAAIGLWALLASMTVAIASIPPLQRLAITFSVATASILLVLWLQGERPLRQAQGVPAAFWLLGLYGLLGYHAAYFFALSGPLPLQANLLNYLWPLLITLLALLTRPRSTATVTVPWRVVAGAIAGFAGTILALGYGVTRDISAYGAATLGAAVAAAVIWSTYSVGLSRFAHVPSSAVAILCGLSAVGAALLHILFETTQWPLSRTAWLILIAQGVGPVGLAFLFWDTAMKHGNVPLLGVVCYTIPIASTALLVVTGQADANANLWAGAALVTIGAALATSAKT